jgi:hypothetical protein
MQVTKVIQKPIWRMYIVNGYSRRVAGYGLNGTLAPRSIDDPPYSRRPHSSRRDAEDGVSRQLTLFGALGGTARQCEHGDDCV